MISAADLQEVCDALRFDSFVRAQQKQIETLLKVKSLLYLLRKLTKMMINDTKSFTEKING